MVTYNSYPLTRRLVEPLAGGVGTEAEEIIIVDSASPDGTGEKLKADFPLIHYLPMPENRGYGAAVNAGAAQARGEWLLVLNGDVEIQPVQVNRLETLAEANGADLLAPLQETPEGEPIPTVRGFPTPWNILFARRSPLGKLLGNKGGYLRPLPVKTEPVGGAVGGACFLVKKESFQKIGGFDPNFFLFAEDTDFCKRLSAVGGRIYFTPEVKVRHFWGFSTGPAFLKTLRYQQDSLLYYFKKHFPGRRVSRTLLVFLFFLQRGFYRLVRLKK